MTPYAALADLVLAIHAGVVAFIVVGQLLIVVGLACHWRWVRNAWFRYAHLAAVGIVVAQSCLGVLCPLTILEDWLRLRADQPGYEHSFVADWLHRLIFYEAEWWVFTLAYTLFAAITLATWIVGPPRWKA